MLGDERPARPGLADGIPVASTSSPTRRAPRCSHAPPATISGRRARGSARSPRPVPRAPVAAVDRQTPARGTSRYSNASACTSWGARASPPRSPPGRSAPHRLERRRNQLLGPLHTLEVRDTGRSVSLARRSRRRPLQLLQNRLRRRVANVSPAAAHWKAVHGRGGRAVTMLVAPGPIDVVHANVASRLRCRAYRPRDAPSTARCARVERQSSRTGAAPAQSRHVPWPKIPRQPANKRERTPSRSTSWQARNRTSA